MPPQYSTAWKEFTPATIDEKRCCARTWAEGVGGQCTRTPRHGSQFCSCHSADQWKVHGKVTGPIPEAKLREFQKVRQAKLKRAAEAVQKKPVAAKELEKAAEPEESESEESEEEVPVQRRPAGSSVERALRKRPAAAESGFMGPQLVAPTVSSPRKINKPAPPEPEPLRSIPKKEPPRKRALDHASLKFTKRPASAIKALVEKHRSSPCRTVPKTVRKMPSAAEKERKRTASKLIPMRWRRRKEIVAPIPMRRPRRKLRTVDDAVDPMKAHNKPEFVLCKVNNVELKRKDFATLSPGSWLNDEIINGFLRLLQVSFNDIWCVNSFFYGMLQQGGHAAVKQWATNANIDVTNLRLLLVPLNLHNGIHWSLAAVNIPAWTCCCLDSLGDRTLHGSDAVFADLQKYLQAEFAVHDLVTKMPLKVLETKAPEQQNCFDCGVFLCSFAASLASCKEFRHADNRTRRFIARTLLGGRFHADAFERHSR